MICLGIESTAHTFGASVVSRKGKVLSDVREMYSRDDGGIIPNEAARHHENIQARVIKEAIGKSKQKKIDLVAYSRGPGFGPCLHVGLNSAKKVAKGLGAEILGVNHCLGHLASANLFTEAKDLCNDEIIGLWLFIRVA